MIVPELAETINEPRKRYIKYKNMENEFMSTDLFSLMFPNKHHNIDVNIEHFDITKNFANQTCKATYTIINYNYTSVIYKNENNEICHIDGKKDSNIKLNNENKKFFDLFFG